MTHAINFGLGRDQLWWAITDSGSENASGPVAMNPVPSMGYLSMWLTL